MEPNPKIIEELRAAGEELEKAEREREKIKETKKENLKPRESRVEKKVQPSSDTPLLSSVEKGKGWVSLQSYQKAILNEKQRLREAYKRIEGLEEKIKERLEMIEKMTVDTERINKELKELGQKIVSIKKENNTLLYQIKEKLGEEEV